MPVKTHIPRQSRAYLFALAAVIFWSTVPTAIKLGIGQMQHFQLLTGAAFTSVFVLAFTIILQGKVRLLLATPARSLLRAAMLGILNPFLYYLILFKAYSLLPGQVAQPLNMIWPLVLVLFSIPMLKQKIGGKSILALVISFSGVILISYQGGTLLDADSSIAGVLIALSTAFIWALYWILNMKSGLDDVINLFLVFLFSSVYLAIVSLFVAHPFPEEPGQWAAAAYLGVFEMGLAFVFWLKALQLSSTTAKISNLVYIAPFLNLIFVHLFLGEKIFLSTVFGIILVVSGIIFQNTIKQRNAKG
jgi:drug/metabolite transporter (DMT)-like permease